MVQMYDEMFDLSDRVRAQRKRPTDLPRLVRLALGLVWSAGRGRAIAMLALTVLTASGAGAVLLATKAGLSSILETLATDGTVTTALIGLIPVAVIASLRAVLLTAEQLLEARMTGDVRLATEARVLRVAAEADLLRFESPDFSNRVRQATVAAPAVTQAAFAAMRLVGSVVTFAGIAIAIVAMAPAVVVLIFIACAPGWWASLRIGRHDYALRRQQVQEMRFVEYLKSVLTGRDQAKEVRAFNLGPALVDKWDASSRKMHEEQLALQRRSSVVRLGAKALDALLYAGVAAFIVWLLVSGRTGLASATTLVLAVQRLRASVLAAIQTTTNIYSAGLLLSDLDQLQREHEEHLAALPQEPVDGPFSVLEVDDVSFRYPGAPTDALSRVTLNITQGEIVALVGENGSGKTTLAKLLAGLYHPTSGAVRWDDEDIASKSPASVRDHVAVIFQDFVRWEFSAAENIGLGRADRAGDRKAVVAAATAAGADEFIAGLPDGYDSVLAKSLTAKGADLSVGQWQRLAIARAMFREAEFIVLDEPTSALDPRAEQALFERIRELCAGRTVLLISHRFSSVRSADRILVLDKGQLIEEGTHRELMALGGQYAELFTLQAAAYLDTSPAVPPTVPADVDPPVLS